MIYTVTTLKTIYGYKNPAYKFELGLRTWGYYKKIDEAQRDVENNVADIYEEGYYPFCVIEEMSEGVFAISFNEYWYQWDRSKNKYIPIEKPKELKHTCCFSMG